MNNNSKIKELFIKNSLDLIKTDISSIYPILQKYKIKPVDLVFSNPDDLINFIKNIENYYNFRIPNIQAIFKCASSDIKSAFDRITKIKASLKQKDLETLEIIRRKIKDYKIVINDLKAKNHLNREAQIKAYDEYLNAKGYIPNKNSKISEKEYRDSEYNKYKIFSMNWKETSEKIARLESELKDLERSISI